MTPGEEEEEEVSGQGGRDGITVHQALFLAVDFISCSDTVSRSAQCEVSTLGPLH